MRSVLQVGFFLAVATTAVSSLLLLIRRDVQDPNGESGQAFRRRWRPVVITAGVVGLVCAVGLLVVSNG